MKHRYVTSPASIWKKPIHFLAFGLGSGTSPIAPGTAGTLVGILVYLVIQALSVSHYAILTFLLFVIGCFICGKTERDIKSIDHPGIVFDEIVGYLVTMMAAPKGWTWVILGFIFFRFFDITKPWPIKLIENYFQGGVAIMLDDVIAGLEACLLIQLLALYFT